jgi:hypothetical protein
MALPLGYAKVMADTLFGIYVFSDSRHRAAAMGRGCALAGVAILGLPELMPCHAPAKSGAAISSEELNSPDGTQRERVADE